MNYRGYDSIFQGITDQVEDSISWKADPSEDFKVFTLYNWFIASLSRIVRHLSKLWKNITLMRVQFLGWLVRKGRLKTNTFL